jgi:hypothetical protein
MPSRAPLMKPFPVVRVAGRFSGGRTTFTIVTVRAPRSAVIRLSCRGKGCPYRSRAVGARLVQVGSLQRTFRAGVVIDVRVTAAGVIGAYTRITVRDSRPPARLDQCLVPGNPRPQPCPPA